MKKVLSLALVLVMMMSLSVTAFAATSEGGDTTINVKGNYVGAAGAGEKISIDVAWAGMEFTYTEGAAGEWIPGEHKYGDDAAGSWSTNKGTITVTNHSNVSIKAELAFATNVNGVIGTFTETSGIENDDILALATAVNTEYANAPKATAEFGISGAAITETKDTLGTITVAISASSGSDSSGEVDNTVTTLDELTAALEAGGNIKLDGDITMTSYFEIRNTVTLDLNGHTLTTFEDALMVYEGATLSVSNGTVSGDSTVKNCGGTVTIVNCTLTAELSAFRHLHGTSSLQDCTINGCVITNSGGTGTVTMQGTFTWGHGTLNQIYTGIYITGEVDVVCDFDPTGHIFKGTVTNNGNGIWTVSKAS